MSTFNPFMLSLMSRVGTKQKPNQKINFQPKESIIKMEDNNVESEQNSFKMISGEEQSISFGKFK